MRWAESKTTFSIIDTVAMLTAFALMIVVLPILTVIRLRDGWRELRGEQYVSIGCGHGYWVRPGESKSCRICARRKSG